MSSTYDWQERRDFGTKAIELIEKADRISATVTSNASAFEEASLLVGEAQVYALLARAD